MTISPVCLGLALATAPLSSRLTHETSNERGFTTMTTKLSLLSRAAAVTGILMLAALPALAQTAPVAPNAPAGVPSATAAPTPQADKVQADKPATGHKTSHKAAIRKHHEQTAQTPGQAPGPEKKTDPSTKSGESQQKL